MSKRNKVKSRPETIKSHLNLVLLGSANSGKGTLLDLLISNGQKTHFHSLISSLENEQLKTFEFETENKKFTLIDCIGHRLFLKNAITRRTKAACALLVISCADLEQKGLGTGAEYQLLLAKCFGWKLVVACSKIDLFPEEKIIKIMEKLHREVQEIGFESKTFTIVPISCHLNLNISSLLEALDALSPTDLSQRPLRLPIQDVFKIGGIGTVPVGRIEGGELVEGMQVIFSPIGLEKRVGQLQCIRYVGEIGEVGMNLGFSVPGMGCNEVTRGFVCSDAKSPAISVKEFTALIYVLPQDITISAGRVLELSCHTIKMPCAVLSLLSRLDGRTGRRIEENPSLLKKENIGIVILRPELTRSFERYCDYPALGHLLLKSEGSLVAVGVIQEVVKEESPRL